MRSILFSTFVSIIILSNNSFAQDDYLFGDWSGKRAELSNLGIDVESILTYDFMRNVKGGIKPGNAGLSNYNITANFDLDKMEFVKGGTVFVYLLANGGHSPTNNYVGDYQVLNNIDTFSTAKLYEFWYQQNFFDDTLSFAFGVHDYNSEFDVLNYGLYLINSSFGMGPDISQVPPSNFPSTTLGARVRYEPTENTYLAVAAYDGAPGDPNHLAGTRISLDSGDGVFTAYELGYLVDSEIDYVKFALGGWYNTRRYEDISGQIRNNNGGVYILTEGKVYDEGNEDSQGLGLFNAIGFADSDRNRTDFYMGGGLAYSGLIPSRDNDILSLGLTYTRNSKAYIDANQSEKFERTFEIIYKYQIAPYFTVSPDFQYIFNPGMDSSLKDATVIGLRTEIAM